MTTTSPPEAADVDPRELVHVPRRYPVTTVYVSVATVLIVVLGIVEAAR